MNASEYARKEGYAGATFLHNWKGYRCYKPTIDNEEGMIGLPLVILEKNGIFHISTPEEALEHFDDMGWSD